MEKCSSELDVQEINEKIIQEIIRNVQKNINMDKIPNNEAIDAEIDKLSKELKTIKDIIYSVNYDNCTKSDIDNLNKSNEKVKISIISRITYLKACKYLNSHKQELNDYMEVIVRSMYK